MAQLISVKLSRFDACPWGFRLQGGKDFGAPLLIQKVNGGSPAEKAGLQAGDAVIKVNDVELFNLRHKEAQDWIVKAGNNFELTVQRGGSTWKPQVTPVGPKPVNYSSGTNVQPVTKTSLAAKKQETPHIGATHNFAPKPFGTVQVNGISDPTVKSIVNKQYNTPVGIYSEETIAETLSAQAEVLAGGVLGVNFKKNERTYNAANSEVLKMVQEIDSEPKDLEPEPTVGGSVTSPPMTGLRHVSAPETKPTPTTPHEDPFKILPPGQNICADCERLIVHAVGGRATSPRPLTPLAHQLPPPPSAPSSFLPMNVPTDTTKCSDCEKFIIGVFVRIKDKNLHVECFKCATCGTSLKNVGYYNINNKLYCDIHAKLVARQNPPAPNLEPITIPPGGRAPAGAISAALGKGPLSPASNFAPAPASNFAPAPASNFAPAPARVAAPTQARAPAPTQAPAPVSPGNLSPQPGTLGPLPFHPVHQHRMPENDLVTENNMKNIISAIPALEIHDTDSGNCLSDPVITKPNKAPRGGTTHVSAPRPVQAPSSLAGPKPFSTPSAPTTSPARPAPAGSKFVWPPSRTEEEMSSPTATPLYIPPTHQHETSGPAAPTGQPAPKLPPESAIKSAPGPVPQPTTEPVPNPMPAPIPSSIPAPQVVPPPIQKNSAPQNFPFPTSAPSQKTVPFPQPFSVFLAKQQHPMRFVSSPVPTDQSSSKLSTQPEPLSDVSPVSYEEDLKAIQDAGLHKKYSMCSQEVFSINVDKPAPKFETLSETLETQMLVSSLTPDPIQRPDSPVPMQDSKTSSIQDIASTVEKDFSKQTAQPVDQVKTVATETVTPPEIKSQPDTQATAPSSDRKSSIPLETISVVPIKKLSEIAQSVADFKSEQLSSTSQSQSISISEKSVSAQQTEQKIVKISEVQSSNQVTVDEQVVQTQSEVISKQHKEVVNETQTSSQISSQSVSGFVPVSREQEYSATQFQQQTRQISSQQSSDLISALTTAPDRPYSPLPTFSNPVADLNPIVIRNPEESVKSIPPHAEDRADACPSPMLAALTVAPDRPYSPLPSATKSMVPAPVQAPPVNTQAPLSRETACPSPLVSALTTAPDSPYSPLPSATKPMAPSGIQSAPVSTQAYPSVIKPAPLPLPPNMQEQSPAIKTVTAAPLPTTTQAPWSREAACPSPMLSALTIAPDRPYSPLPPATESIRSAPTHTEAATKSTTFAPVQTSLISTPATLSTAVRPSSPMARGTAYPSFTRPAPLPLPVPSSMQPAQNQLSSLKSQVYGPLPSSTQLSVSREVACPSPLLSALTVAPDRPYSPLPSATKASDFEPFQTPARPVNPPFPGAIKVLPSDSKPPVAEQLLRDETQLPLLATPTQQVSMVSALTTAPDHPYSSFPAATQTPTLPTSTKPESTPAKVVTKPQSVSTGPLPVIGAFRPIVSGGFKPIPSEDTSVKEPHSSFPPVSDKLKEEFSVPPIPRPITPIQRVSTPTPGSRSGTPSQQKLYSMTGLQKPATIPSYQQQMGEFPGQRPRSATPTCPMLVPQSSRTPQPQLTKPETSSVPQKPSASFQRQPPPQKPYASYQPQPVQKVSDAPVVAQQLSQTETHQSSSIPFPNIPLPEGMKPESLTTAFKPASRPLSSGPIFKPSPLPVPQPAPSGPVFQPSSLVAPQPAPSASAIKTSPLAAPQPLPSAPKPSVSAPVPATPKTVPVSATQPVSIAKTPSVPSSSSVPNAGGGGVGAPGGVQKGATYAGSSAPRRGRGILTQQSSVSGGRIPLCAHCSSQIRGPFITALGKNWCPEHFVCVNGQCRRPLADIGFVEEKGELYCEYCFEKYLAPTCDKCNKKVKGDCLNAIGKHFHPECFLCAYCGKLFGNNPFFLEDGLPYCEADWNELFTTKCFACGFPIEAGDRWVEALSNNYHSQCFNCTNCKKNLEGQSFYAKGGRPFCKAHAR